MRKRPCLCGTTASQCVWGSKSRYAARGGGTGMTGSVMAGVMAGETGQRRREQDVAGTGTVNQRLR